MSRKRKSVAVSIDLDLLEAGRAVVADGRAWSFSAWVNEALRQKVEEEKRFSAEDGSANGRRAPGTETGPWRR